MKLTAKSLFVLVLFATVAAHAQYPPNSFKHVILIVQENRTPDNLFQGLCSVRTCGTGVGDYDIASTWTDSTATPHPLESVGLAANYDLSHNHGGTNGGFNFELINPGTPVPGACGTNVFGCAPDDAQFKFVFNTPVTNKDGSAGHLLDPYVTLASQYGWANKMFQTNQGPSYPAHQFLFGATSAPGVNEAATQTNDSTGVFIAENGPFTNVGCAAINNPKVQLVRPIIPMPPNPPFGTETTGDTVSPCFDHVTMSDLLDMKSLHWRYYAPTEPNPGNANIAGGIWTAPNSLSHMCTPVNNQCTGPDWTPGAANGYIDLHPADILTDIQNCNLQSMSWVIPDGRWSDHPGGGQGTGPAWVAAIVNAIGNSKGTVACNYWDDPTNATAIFITWDDWGGWFDHVPPVILTNTSTYVDQYDYQLGFRVPLIVVSAYTGTTSAGIVNNNQHDFGSILRAIEGIFALPGGEGALGFADKRATNDLSAFFNFSQTPHAFTTIPAVLGASDFINATGAPMAPDND